MGNYFILFFGYSFVPGNNVNAFNNNYSFCKSHISIKNNCYRAVLRQHIIVDCAMVHWTLNKKFKFKFKLRPVMNVKIIEVSYLLCFSVLFAG
jgi:hypothetical protein